MRKSVFLALLLFFSVGTFAQKKKKNDKAEPAKQETVVQQPQQQQPVVKEEPKKDTVPQINPLVQHFYYKYQLATQWGDSEVAKSALYDLIIQNPSNDSLVFQLAYYYFQSQKYLSSALISQELLKRNPKNTSVLEVAAISYENLGANDRALQSYESLYLLQNSPMSLYKMATLQLQLKRYKESSTSVDILMASKEAETLKVTYTGADNKAKEYPLKVALLNIKGVLSQEQGDKISAKKFFDMALAQAPDFVPAKDNLSKLK
ncbi:MAG TPA: hypothetical protein DGG95_03620 [Cytophagales bacterium]|jgi:tetratricopeptide (TPR) repeat protein|nr:hypothetical protein [Cytophagales bacterium]